MIKFRSQMFLTLLALLVIVLIGVGLILGQLFKTYYFQNFNEHLEKETRLVADYIEGIGGIQTSKRQIISDFSKELDARITIIDI